jgi:colanic acid/amylovoran biosynthesis glycosyltransferase
MSAPRPRAALFCRLFLPYSETFIHDELVNHVRWDVEVFCQGRLNQDRFPFDKVYVPRGRAERALYRLASWSPEFARQMRDGGHRLVHAHFGTTARYALRHAARRPMVVTFHGFDVGVLVGHGRFHPKYWRWWAASRRVFARADLMLCASEELADIVSRLSGRQQATRVYRLGVDLGRFTPRERPPGPARVIMVGRFVEKKGHLDGIEAFAGAVGRGADARLTIVGDGALRDRYRARIAELGIVARVELPGQLPAARVAELLGQSDVLLAPSHVARDGDRDSGLMVAKEASASETAVIGTRHGGIAEILEDGVTGYLVAERDVVGMAERLHALVSDRDLRERLGRAGRAKMERDYDVRERVAELERIYDELV